MDAERWRRARALFDQLADLPAGCWEAELQARCPDDDAVRAEALALLRADAESQSTALSDRAPDLLSAAAHDHDAARSAQLAGTRVGPFRLVRELGPVVTALLFAGRAGTSLTAEIGLMKAGEQLSAMEMMAVNPLQRVLAPRFWAGVLSMPVLAALFNLVGIFGGYTIAVLLLGIDEGTFWGQMQANVRFYGDVVNGLIKSAVFGVAVTLIAVFEGYDAQPTAEGVSAATTRTVVTSSVVILMLDFILTAFMFQGN